MAIAQHVSSMKTAIDRPITSILVVLLCALGVGCAARQPATQGKAATTAQTTTPSSAEFKTVTNAIRYVRRPAELEQKRLPAYLGLRVQPNKSGHLVITELDENGAAVKAGIQLGDIVSGATGKPFKDAAGLREWLATKRSGGLVDFQIERDRKKLTLPVKLGQASQPLNSFNEATNRLVIGATLQAAANGAQIVAVQSGLPAEKAGMKPGDIVLKVDGRAVREREDVSAALALRKAGDTLKFLYKRNDMEHEIELKPVLTTNAPSTPVASPSARAGFWTKPVYRLAVIPIAYPDVAFNAKITTNDWANSIFSTHSYTNTSATGQAVYGSMNDYYGEQSCGKFRIEGAVFPPVEVSKKRAEYSSTPSRTALLDEAMNLLTKRDGADALKNYDGIFFLYAGARLQTTRGGLYWPHRSNFTYKGKSWGYFICPEGGSEMASISVISHEFGHMLGLPDLYAKPEVPGSEGVGVWCTMSNGHGRDGKPLHISAWCKEKLGWLNPVPIDPSLPQKLSLAPIRGRTNECFKIIIQHDDSEYLLLENRARLGYDRDLPAEGLLIWRVVDGRPVLEESHGITDATGPRSFLGSVPYPSKSNTAFTPSTVPSSQPIRLGGMPVHITQIQRLPDGRIRFRIGDEFH